ncbi:hypothetical protein [Fibrobacter sp.]
MKKEYMKPELKEVELKRRASLLECSDKSVCGELGLDNSAVKEIAPKA